MRFFFFQAEDGIRDLVRSRGLGDVYKRQRMPDLLSHREVQNENTPIATRHPSRMSARRRDRTLSLIHI